MIKYGGEELKKEILDLCIEIWESEKPPQEWSKGVIVPIFKSGDKYQCKNYRGITLISIVSKIFCIIVLNRMKMRIDEKLREQQAGFRKGRACTDQLSSLRTLIEKSSEFEIQFLICFIDFKAAFDSVDRKVLWAILEQYGIPTKILNIIKNIYETTECCIKVEKDYSNWFEIRTGVRQGCIWSPLLFNLVIDWVMKEALDKQERGLTLQKAASRRHKDWRLSDLDFADDVAVFEETAEEMQKSLNQINAKANGTGLVINELKTHIMPINGPINDPTQITIDGKEISHVTKFKYLGSTFTSKGDLETEINLRIAKASIAFSELKNVWSKKSIQMDTKFKLYNAIVISTLLYGAETWALRATDEARLNAFGAKCIRRILGIKWSDYIPNHELYQKSKQVPIAKTIRKRRIQWFGHIMRMEDSRITRKMLNWNPKGTAKRGRKKANWLNNVQTDALTLGTDIDHWGETAKDKKKWRKILLAL